MTRARRDGHVTSPLEGNGVHHKLINFQLEAVNFDADETSMTRNASTSDPDIVKSLHERDLGPSAFAREMGMAGPSI